MENEKRDANPELAIVIENPEVIGDTYTGEIMSVHTGYVFIHNIKRGYETIGTNGDVFCPVPLDINFATGEIVQFFELNPDKERVGKFRTEKITIVNSGLELNTPEGRMHAIVGLSKALSPYHQLKKIISGDDIAKAAENKPLAEFIQQIGWVLNQNGGYDPEKVNKIAEDFVAKTFSMLTPLGVKCSIMDDIDKVEEANMIEATISLYKENQLEGQAESLKNEYTQFFK